MSLLTSILVRCCSVEFIDAWKGISWVAEMSLLHAQLAGQARGAYRCRRRQQQQQIVCSTAGAVAAPFDDAGQLQ